jgi:hypothetical protein
MDGKHWRVDNDYMYHHKPHSTQIGHVNEIESRTLEIQQLRRQSLKTLQGEITSASGLSVRSPPNLLVTQAWGFRNRQKVS